MDNCVIEQEIEFKRRNGSYGYIYVDFTVQGSITNDSFDYAGTHCTHGLPGTYVGSDYFEPDGEISYDKTKHQKWERRIINKWIDDETNKEKLDDKAGELAMERAQDIADRRADDELEYRISCLEDRMNDNY